MVAGVYAGAPGDASAALAPLTRLGTPLVDMSGTVDYLDVQTGVDAAFPSGGRYFFKSHFVDALSDRAIETLLDCDATPTQPGVADRHPDPRWLGLHGRRGRERLPPPWRPVQRELRCRLVGPGAGRRWRSAGLVRRGTPCGRFATGGVYLNFAGLDHEADRSAVYGSGAERLDRIRNAYDPHGIFAAAADRP